MKILINFEDEHGCASLFEYSKCNKSRIDYSITPVVGLSCTGVFTATKSILKMYDKVIFIFDLDAIRVKGVKPDVSLNRESMVANLRKYGIVDINGDLTNKCIGKVAFIPVIFCYETINLYSDYLIEVLNNLDKMDNNNQNIKKLKLLKSYFDYSQLNPEYLDGASYIAEEIHKELCKITGDNSSKQWKTQQIHLSFSKNLLTTYFRGNNYELKSDDLCEKRETDLFLEMKLQNTELQPENMIEDFNKKAIDNRLFADLMMCETEHEITEVCNRATLENALNIIDKYNAIVKKQFKKKQNISNSVKLCEANIEIMLSYGVRSINKIKSTLRKQGFDTDTIDEAIENLTHK